MDSSQDTSDAGPKLPNALVRSLKARAQHLDPVIKVGHAGVTAELLASLDSALSLHELVKVKFTGQKELKDELSGRLAGGTRSHLVWRIGHCAVLFRARRPQSSEGKGAAEVGGR